MAPLGHTVVHAPQRCATTARRTGEGWVLNGMKRFVLDGHVADALLVLARTDGGVDDATGLSLFLLDASTAGLTRRRLQMVDSRNSADVGLSEVHLPADALLGNAGEAAQLLGRTLDIGRIMLAAEMLGLAEEAFEMTLGYLKQRTQFAVVGRLPDDFDAVVLDDRIAQEPAGGLVQGLGGGGRVGARS